MVYTQLYETMSIIVNVAHQLLAEVEISGLCASKVILHSLPNLKKTINTMSGGYSCMI